MANFKNNGVMSAVKNFCVSVLAFLWVIIKNVMALFIGCGATVWLIFLLITSPIWFSVLVKINPARAAHVLNERKVHDCSLRPEWLDWWVVQTHKWFIYHLMRGLWTPVVALVPMRYRAEFIREGKKRVCDYSVKTQLAYYRSHGDESKQNLLKSGVFSLEAQEAIWADPSELKNWIDAGLELSPEQVKIICERGDLITLCRYFRRHTPSKKVINILVDNVRRNYAAANDVMLNLIRQQRPNGELIDKLLATGNSSFIERMSEIIDSYADMDAVSFDISGGRNEEETNLLTKCWRNFCRNKKEISEAAQKKMSYEQYKIFFGTGHKLTYGALRHLLLNIHQGACEYLKEVIMHEFVQIDAALQTALKTEYWRYSLYLEVKEGKKAA